MSKVQAWEWLDSREEFNLTKSGRLYTLSIPGASVQRESVIECVIDIRKAINA